MEEKLICSVCGKTLTEEIANHFDGQIMCKDCFELKTTVCECCGERIWEEDARGNSRIILCNHCYEYNYTNCEECGTLIHNDDAYYENSDNDYPYCYTCYEKLFKSSIKSYCYKPDPIFYGSGSFYMGVELEIDDGGEDNDNADELLCIGNFKNNRIYCKHDGSIENGFEIVSHPSFSFSILDDKDNIYLVKGDSPLCILHFPKEKIYKERLDALKSALPAICKMLIEVENKLEKEEKVDYIEILETLKSAKKKLKKFIKRYKKKCINDNKTGKNSELKKFVKIFRKLKKKLKKFNERYKTKSKVIPQMLTTVFLNYNRKTIIDVVNRELDCDFTDIIIAGKNIDVEKTAIAICGNV